MKLAMLVKNKLFRAIAALKFRAYEYIARDISNGYLQLAPVLAEYPKSGGSLLFFLLSHIVCNRSDLCDSSPHIYASTRYSIDLDRSISNVSFLSAALFQIEAPFPPVKTHSDFDQRFFSVICLFRSPLNLMRSYYRYLSFSGAQEYENLESLLRCEKKGIPSWLKFYQSYLSAPMYSQIHFVSFEDLVSSPVETIDHLMQAVYGLRLNAKGSAYVKTAAEIDYGRRLEDLVLSHDPRRIPGQRFVGSEIVIPGDMAELPSDFRADCEALLSILRRGC